MLKHVARYHDDMDYYINKNVDIKELERFSQDIEQCRKELAELEQAIYKRYNELSQVYYKHVVNHNKNRNRYSTDKRVTIEVSLQKESYIDGVKQKSEHVNGKSKSFSYIDKKQAEQYAADLSKEYQATIDKTF